MEGLIATATNNLLSVGVIVATGYLVAKLVADLQVWSVHRKIVAWGYDNERVRWTGGANSLEDWFRSLPDIALESPAHLAKEAAIGANIIIRGSLSDDSIARLGLRLQKSWGYLVRIEKERRAADR